jgi:Domain of unknown function (DUF4340)
VEPEAIPLRYRSTILYLVAALLLVGIYLYDIHQGKEKEQLKEAAKVLLGIKTDQIEGIILAGGNETIELQKTKGTDKNAWNITAPIRAAADSSAIERLKNRLADLKYTRIIAEKADDLARFGLDDPSFIITYNTGKESGRLAFGSLTPLADGYYVSKDKDKRIYLVDNFDKEKLFTGLFELRDKRLFTLSPEKVNRFIIERGADKWTLIKKEGQWQFKDDKGFRVDTQKMDTLVRKFAWAEALSFEKERVNDLKPFGLDSSAVVVTLSDGKKGQSILLGNPVKLKRTEIYAKIKDQPQLITINKWLLNDLPQNRGEIKEEKAAEETKDTETNR